MKHFKQVLCWRSWWQCWSTWLTGGTTQRLWSGRQVKGCFWIYDHSFIQVRGLASLPRVTAVAMFMSLEAQAKLKEVLKELDCLAGPGEREVWQKAFSV